MPRCPSGPDPGLSRGRSPESITTGRSMALNRRKFARTVVMDSGLALPAPRNDAGVTLRRL